MILRIYILIEIFIILQAGGMYFNYKHSSLIRKRQSEILEELSNYWFVSEVLQGQNFVYIGINLSIMNHCLEHDMILTGT